MCKFTWISLCDWYYVAVLAQSVTVTHTQMPAFASFSTSLWLIILLSPSALLWIEIVCLFCQYGIYPRSPLYIGPAVFPQSPSSPPPSPPPPPFLFSSPSNALVSVQNKSGAPGRTSRRETEKVKKKRMGGMGKERWNREKKNRLRVRASKWDA